jgi:hypothetical protein
MSRTPCCPIAAVVLLLGAGEAIGQIELSSPGFGPSQVAGDGSLVEPWGEIRLQIIEPAPGQIIDQRAESDPMPMAITCQQAGPVTLTQTAYRAPVWPSGVDVLEATVANTDPQTPVRVQVELRAPEAMELGETTGSIRGQPVLALPIDLQPIREEREWGCVGGVRALPGWAKPIGACDPAFANISAGMGGVPITYRFAVAPGSQRTVVLGFCEGHHPTSGLRPVVALVEGAAQQAIDPIDAWGRNQPGVVRFDAADTDGDGRLSVSVAPHPRASDRNTILNVIWIFDPQTPLDERQLIEGHLNERAERYVDVGGQQDQGLYKSGDVRYALQLDPGQQREFCFLVASPGCRSVPDPSLGLWNPQTLRKAAADVWRDRWVEPEDQEQKQ